MDSRLHPRMHHLPAEQILTHQNKVPIYHIPTSEGIKPFQQVSMDLITGLPTWKGYDAILTIVDHGCSRAAIFLPCTTKITGLGIAQPYLDYIYQWWGLPIKIISDRDPQFTSHFGRNLTKKLGIQQNLSTTAHPKQMDFQNAKINGSNNTFR